ncbi:hypothetical protein [Streptomyces chattanoogensis]|uniref:hypothetical protein n=1 Tax=Streptomyces chattanoogensis TaxID=66876 RepID=UPI0036957EF6
MTHPTNAERILQAAAEKMTMFHIEAQPDNGAILHITSLVSPGQLFRQRYALDQRMVCALRGAIVRELGHIEMPPLPPEYAALRDADPSDHAAVSAAAEALSRLMYEQIFPPKDGNGAA